MSAQIHNSCPICGSPQLETRRSDRHQCILTHRCPVCDFRCDVVEAADTPPTEVQNGAWIAEFSQD